jgi:hypothetical protein
MLTKQSIKKNLKKWGYKSHTESIDDFLNNKLNKFVKQKAQTGGRVVLPSEYFGVDSGKYSVDASPGTDMSVTDSLIRPAVVTSDPSGAIVGGGQRKFEISARSVSEILKNNNCKLCASHKKSIKEDFESKLTSALQKASKKGGEHLSLSTLKKLL